MDVEAQTAFASVERVETTIPHTAYPHHTVVFEVINLRIWESPYYELGGVPVHSPWATLLIVRVVALREVFKTGRDRLSAMSTLSPVVSSHEKTAEDTRLEAGADATLNGPSAITLDEDIF